MKNLLILALLCLASSVGAQAPDADDKRLFVLSADKRFRPTWLPRPGHDAPATLPAPQPVTPADRYTAERGYGYDLLPSLADRDSRPFFFSVQVPDGNYRVVVTLGSRKEAGSTTVRAESRRLMAESVETRKGEYKQVAFTVNKHNPRINERERVRIKPREEKKLNWDDKLTLEFNGDRPVCAAIQIEPVSDVPTVFLCGNSTVVDQDDEPWASWGQMIPCFFDEEVCVANYAESGESANTFIAAGRLAKALSQMKAGDYLFVEFGHNDQKQQGPGKGAYYSFATSLKTFIDEARLRGATPVFVTPTQRRAFKNGRIQETHADYPEAMQWVADREQVALIDLHRMTRTLFEALGEEGSKRAFVHYPAGTFPGQTKAFADNTHFNPYGAYQIARCLAEGLKAQLPELARHLRPACGTYDPARPDDPDTFRWHASPFVDLQKPDGN